MFLRPHYVGRIERCFVGGQRGVTTVNQLNVLRWRGSFPVGVRSFGQPKVGPWPLGKPAGRNKVGSLLYQRIQTCALEIVGNAGVAPVRLDPIAAAQAHGSAFFRAA